ncbi:nuclease [Paenibacillus sp. BJ-4]|uniref:nuclease n=1 Tax=Paenibacillus sp. BJ-4 TaxID=2878097 RepID=UPI001CF0813C|nr:nuclease [Paenibacillus sp. BJ-4]
MFRWIVTLLATILLAGCSVQQDVVKTTRNEPVAAQVTQVSADTVKLEFPSAKYPETARHIKEAIAAGESSVCTIDREGAEHNRELSLKGVPTCKGKDHNEWPMAMCADIKHINPKDNRRAGSWVGHKLDDYSDGMRVELILNKIPINAF